MADELSADAAERCIFLAYDFGTTFSACAWAQASRPEIQTIINQWPQMDGNLEGATSDKVPTELASRDNEIAWGFQISEDEMRHQWFKLGLETKKTKQKSRLNDRYPDPKALSGASYEEAVDLTTKYLRCLHNHCLSILKLKLGPGVLESTPIKPILTTPAIWSERAMATTASCAKAAGMGDSITMISEPEAAVIYALDALDPHGLSPGDSFVLVDAGGGTVDLVSYTIDQLQPKVKIREIVAGEGRLCGSTFLNRIFRENLEKQYKHLEGWESDTLESAMSRFEDKIKRNFNGFGGDIVIPVPGLTDDEEKRVKRQKLLLSAAEMKDWFEPVMTTITAMVRNQINRTKDAGQEAKAILLVGGMGAMPYLRTCIEEEIGSDIPIIQHGHTWTAVVRGALMKALDSQSTMLSRINVVRKARKAYGIKIHDEFITYVHEDRWKFWSHFYGRYRCTLMDWIIKQNSVLDETVPLIRQYQSVNLVSEGAPKSQRVRICSFYAAEGEELPEYPDGGANKLVDLTADLTSIHESKIPKERGKDRKMYYVLDYEIHTVFFSAHTEYKLFYEGVCYGSVKADYA